MLSNVDGLSGEESEIFDGDEGGLSVKFVICGLYWHNFEKTIKNGEKSARELLKT